MARLITRFHADETGATAIEYGMIAALIAAAIIGTLQTLGASLTVKFTAIAAQLN